MVISFGVGKTASARIGTYIAANSAFGAVSVRSFPGMLGWRNPLDREVNRPQEVANRLAEGGYTHW
ncbi:MAG: hypothetical protein AAFO91_19655 [Bacteroidota bacterium]